MLLTIHGLPYSTKYQDLKQLIKDKCNISDFILDNLVSEGSNAKKVRIGLTDDGDGKLLMKCLDGIRLGGSLLHVVPVSKNQPNEGPSLDRQGNAKASTFGNPPQYGNSGQPSQSVLWSGNSNLWQPTPLQTSSYNYDAPANVYPAQQAPIAPRAEIPQLNVHQMDAFQNRPVLQQDHCKPIPPPVHPTRTAALREIQTVDTAPQNMYKPPSNQYVPNKPMTIKKDNFQGPQSNLDLRGSQMQAPKQSNAMLWLTQGHQNDTFSQNIRDSRGPNDRSGRYSPVDVPMNDARRMPPTHRQNDDRLMSQQSHHMSQQDRRISPQGRKMTPQGRRMSPPGRKMSPPGRKMSPQGRRMSPQGRKMSPEGRRMSPQGRKMSPQGRRMSPQGRKMSPQGRRLSPSYRMMQGRKTSPGRQVSPPRRNMEREPDRYSPKRHVPDDTLNPRPRFDGSNTRPPAPSQAIYGDGFRGNVQYPVTAARPQLSSWQFGNNKPEDDRRPNYEPRAPSPRKSRSPVRRGRSPLKDRFKRHSPSPRSPRRSWALEKRRSPDVTEAPPPPNWPGSKEDTYPPNKPDTFPGVWDRNKYDEIQSPESDSMRSNTRPSRDATPPHRQMYKSEQPQYEAPAPKVSKHQLVEEDRRDFRHPHSMRSDVMDVQIDRPVVRDLLKDRQDYRQPPKSEQQSREEDIVQKRLNTYKRREPEPTRYEEKKPLRVTERLDKEIEDIYKRTAEFKKKAEVFRNAEERRREEERRKDEAFQESLRHSMERDPPKDRHDFRKDDQRPDDRRPDDRRFGRDDFRKRSLPRSTNQEMHQQVDQSRMPQFESNRGVMDKEDLKSKSLDRRDDRRDHRWVDRREDRRDDRRDGRSHEKPEDHRADRHDDRRIARKDDHYNPRVDEHRKQDQKDKACSELAERMLDRRENKKWKSDLRLQVKEALRQSIMKILNDMFKDKEASFIEYTVKFRAYYDENDQDKIFDKVMTNLNALPFKRPAPDVKEIQPKALRRDLDHRNVKEVTDWDIAPANVSRDLNAEPMQPMLSQFQSEFVQGVSMQPNFVQVVPMHQEPIPQFLPMEAMMPTQKEEINLYLCKDDFECFTEIQLEYLRKFLFSEIERESQNSNGWAPDFSFKPMQSLHRYELKTYDERTKDWIMQINFAYFKYFNVLVYTKEELWYERAAVWLPGHSRLKMDPFSKLKLQNRLVEELSIEKWKMVKTIVTEKGTRIYVDMPPASARALEKHKMMLSYELQKVNVLLKAVAVDKEAFDKGLLGDSWIDSAVVLNAVKSCPIPILSNDSQLVKIVIKGTKTMEIGQARKIKEMLLYQIYKYHQQKGKYRTDFLKYGICPPNFFAVLPENTESRKFLMNTNLGTLNRAPVIVVGRDGENASFFRMQVYINRFKDKPSASLITERLRTSNIGIKGLNVHLWKFHAIDFKTMTVHYDVDFESVEVIIKLNYKLDYSGFGTTTVVSIVPVGGKRRLEEKIKNHKAESSDTYEEANMDISDSDPEDVICLD